MRKVNVGAAWRPSRRGGPAGLAALEKSGAKCAEKAQLHVDTFQRRRRLALENQTIAALLA